MTAARLALMALAVSLLATSGCASAIAHAPTMVGRSAPPEFGVTTSRERVDAELGAPVAVTRLPDGGYTATYRYRVRPSAGSKAARGIGVIESFMLREGKDGLALWFFLQPVLIPAAIASALHDIATPNRDTVTFTYGPHGDLLHAGRPPAYGPDEDAIAPPSLGALRASCRTGADHVDCLARRFAIWGIE